MSTDQKDPWDNRPLGVTITDLPVSRPPSIPEPRQIRETIETFEDDDEEEL